MLHFKWQNSETIKSIRCVHADAKKYKVDSVLTPGKDYDVKNETDEFYFVIDDTGKVGGFLKDYFEEK
ncbi:MULTISPECIES: DUF6501 family protein [Geomicrobium]|uniref:Uncharacterized protein n=1 Tax=Geomicrobium sediminis TaxID=1347788 RepID=A0ABS2PDP2_9BACL|nr:MULTISPECIES: DUF6501 family protein [Geomicrobium]MBM7633449.1 hypothetical protein [Geomicrobium sediminis]GAK00016.1 hypothetical protein JCM19055_3081 [Geomicrobium sp. JCM 19055]